jgi:FkbM family methyltransferase
MCFETPVHGGWFVPGMQINGFLRLRQTVIAALLRCRPIVPPQLRLPFLMLLGRAGGGLEPELLHLRSFVPFGGAAVDVGANYGMYSYALSRIVPKVYSFEINPALTEDLDAYSNPKIEVIRVGLSSRAAHLTLYVPISSNGFAMSGWGTLDPVNLPPGVATIKQIEVRVKPLDEFVFVDVSFVKIDVEGHEVEVLAGARETITRCRPTVLIEVKDANSSSVDSYFAAVQYQKFTLADLVGVQGAEENRIYIPAERVLRKR